MKLITMCNNETLNCLPLWHTFSLVSEENENAVEVCAQVAHTTSKN